jgi:hypothetical protein
MLFDAMGEAFRVLGGAAQGSGDPKDHWKGCGGGVAGRGIFDNMKTAVDQIGTGPNRIGRARQVNKRFAAMAQRRALCRDARCVPAAAKPPA